MHSYYKDIYDMLCEKYPNRKIYVISDEHFYHSNIIKYERNEFNNIEEMHEYIIKKHNEVVGTHDIVIFLGDFSFKKSGIKEILTKMNGHKYLLLGNHDNIDLIKSYGALGLEKVFVNPIKIDNNYLSHYPLKEDELDNFNFNLLVKEFNKSDGINYHGHIHTRDKGELPFVNVCCEANDYKPVLIGYTKEIDTYDKPLLINDKYFNEILEFLKQKQNIDSSLIISDYLYSSLLDSISNYSNSSFIYGSFPLFRKYGFISDFSDLDVGITYNENISKGKNSTIIRNAFYDSFESSKKIYDVDSSIYKRMNNVCIFEMLYKNSSGDVYKGYYDSNLVPLDVYKDSDFIEFVGVSMLEKLFKSTSLDEFKLPNYKARFLNMYGDISNLILQLLFQEGFDSKKILALKKLKYICKNRGLIEIEDNSILEDTIIRFFIRNILFFHTTRRFDEITYINSGYHNIDEFLNTIPLNLNNK